MRRFFAIIAVLAILAPGVVRAAISFVNATENSSVPNTDTTVTLSGLGLQEGDLVIVSGAIGDNDSLNLNIVNNTAGYQEVVDIDATTDTQDVTLGVWWKLMGSTPDTSVVIEGSTGGTDSALAVVVMAFRGVNSITPFDASAVSTSGINTMHPNPPSIDHNNPSGVWTVIAGASGQTLSGTGSGTLTYTFPTGYTTNKVEEDQGDTSDVTVGMGYRSSGVSDPEDPGTMTHSGTDSTAFSWAAATLALRPATAPTVTTQDASSITSTGATFNGNLTNNNGATSTVRGFAWGTSATMNGDTATTTESGTFDTGAFTDSAQTLVCNTTYYYRPYAVNIAGTSTAPISNSFTTSACASLTVTNSTGESNLGNTSATMNGDITILGGSNVTARGFAWGTNATLSNGDTSTTTDTVGQPFSTGVFSQNVINLRSNTTYYYRAYATDTSGNSYASTIESFVTTNTSSLRRVIRLFQGSRLNIMNGGKMIIRQQ